MFLPTIVESCFYNAVDEDHGMIGNARRLAAPQEEEEEDETDNVSMIALMDVLQSPRDESETTCGFASPVARNKHRGHTMRADLEHKQRLIAAVSEFRPSFVEIYGRGRMIEASHKCVRYLNAHGLQTSDIRTCTEDGSPWGFNRTSDRGLVRQPIEYSEPAWLVCSPPCTALSRLNANRNFPRVTPDIVASQIKEGRRQLRFVLSLWPLQFENGRRFLVEQPAGGGGGVYRGKTIGWRNYLTIRRCTALSLINANIAL